MNHSAFRLSHPLAGRRVLLTGATGHLGQAMAFGLAEAGAELLVNGRSQEKCSRLVEQLCDAGYTSAQAIVFDVCDSDAPQICVDVLEDRPLHVLINNAYSGKGGTIETAQGSDYIRAIQVTIGAAQNLVRGLLPSLRSAAADAGDASIINVASMYGLVSPDPRVYNGDQGTNPPFYGAAKAALIQFTRYAACEFGRENIRSNALVPGAFPSLAVQKKDSELVARLAKKVPMERVGRSCEIAGPTVFLASSSSSYVNGASLLVDGGWTAW